LRHHVATTVHSAIGHTMTSIATELTAVAGVWERAMVVVLISRVCFAKDLIFVGSKDENVEALLNGLRIRCQYDDYMNHIVNVLSGTAVPGGLGPIELTNHPCRPRDITLPSDRSGFVYLLVSVKDGATLYVGMTQNLPLRLNQHNSGYGSRGTMSTSLRPWALYAYVTGFAGQRSLMARFESAWQGQNAYRRPPSPSVSVMYAQYLIEGIFAEHELTVVVSTLR
jgi:predicted GIY-YIG superfamily endonuclease